MAAAGARGYRVGTQHGPLLLVPWFTAVKLRQVPMFALEPFEWPVVPVRGTYAVTYMNRRCKVHNAGVADLAPPRSPEPLGAPCMPGY